MEPMEIVWTVGGILVIALFAWGLRQRPRGDGPPPRKSRNAFERFYDTPEHSDEWERERRSRNGSGRERRDEPSPPPGR